MTPPARVAVFDAYGTLFDVSAAARAAAEAPGGEALAEVWPRLSARWRERQLQYAWTRTLMGRHEDFWTITCDALDHAMAACGLGDPDLRELLRALYRRLGAYPEARAALEALRASGVATAILSNGSPDMLADAVEAADLASLLDDVLSVEQVRVYKPDPRVYALVERRFAAPPQEVLFVSSNGWDVAGAAAFGFRTVWVNRAGEPPERTPWPPAHTVADLSAVPELAAA
jgi:2-haloacid dehalogenase